MTEWPILRLGEVTDLRSGFAFKSRQWKNTGVPVVKIGNVKPGLLDLDGCSYVSEEDAIQSKFLLSQGDILIGLTGYVGSTCVVKTCEAVVLNQRVGVFRPNSCKVDPSFLYCLVSDEAFKSRVVGAAYGSAQPNISPRQILDFEVKMPPLNEQKSIATLLGTLNDKIELNRHMSATLEEMARALYQSWFVDFDPVHARALGQTPAHMDATTAALFPDSFGPDGLPKGWQWRSLDDIADFLNGAALQKFPPKDGADSLPVIKIAELRGGVTSKSGRAGLQVPEKYKISNGDVLFSWSGSLLQKVWTEGPGALNQHLFKVSSDVVPKWFHFFAVDQHMEEFRQVAASKATTMGHIQRHHLKEAMIAIPNDDAVIIVAGKLVGPALDRAIAANLESQTLAALRDSLLPRLMSGELRIREAEKQIEEVI